jgi:hypothetical protein
MQHEEESEWKSMYRIELGVHFESISIISQRSPDWQKWWTNQKHPGGSNPFVEERIQRVQVWNRPIYELANLVSDGPLNNIVHIDNGNIFLKEVLGNLAFHRHCIGQVGTCGMWHNWIGGRI